MADLSKENKLQREAFEFYYGLGNQRSLKAVASHFNRSERTVAGWSRDLNWVDRVKQKELDEAEGKEKQGLMLDVKVTYRKVLNNLLAVFSKDFKEGKIKIKSIQDLERVIKLDLLLMGDAVDKVENDGVELTEEDKKALDQIAQALKGVNTKLSK